MTLNSVRAELFPAHYNHLLLNWRREQRGLSIRAVARVLGVHQSVMSDVFHGLATNKTVFPVAEYLGLDWATVHDLSLRDKADFEKVAGAVARGAHLIAPSEVVSNSP